MIQACAIAAVFEFGGAMVLGRVSTQTIAGSIANPEEFQDNPMIYGERGGKGGSEAGE
jgi:sodium-dependent phosphate transporter